MAKQGPVYVFLANSLMVTSTFAASFNCEKASTTVERLICLDSNLSTQDEALSKAYTEAREKLDVEGKSKLKKEQVAWLSERNTCSSANCLQASMSSRIEFLKTGKASVGTTSKAEPAAVQEPAKIVESSKSAPAAQEPVKINEISKETVHQPTSAPAEQQVKVSSPAENAAIYQAEIDRKEELEDPLYVERQIDVMLAKVKSILAKDLMTEQDQEYMAGIVHGAERGYKGYTMKDLSSGMTPDRVAEFKSAVSNYQQRMAEKQERLSQSLRYIARPNDATKAKMFTSCAQMADASSIWLPRQGYDDLYDAFADLATIFSSAREVSASAPGIKSNLESILVTKAMPERQRAMVDYLKVCFDKYKGEEVAVQRWRETAREERRKANGHDLGLR